MGELTSATSLLPALNPWKAREILHALEFPASRHRSLVNELCRWVRQGILDRTGAGN